MSQISKNELFKEFEHIFDSDLRICEEVSINSDFFKNFHKWIATIQLSNSVPEQVLINFETAKNTLLYSFFSYRLCVPATLFALATLEMALEYRAKLNGHYFKTFEGLEKKFRYAFKKKFIDIQKLAPSTVQNNDWQNYTYQSYIPYYCYLRNELAHGSIILEGPGAACDLLSDISYIINSLFEFDMS